MTTLVSLSRHRPRLLAGIALLGALLSGAVCLSLYQAEQEQIDTRFQRRAEFQLRLAAQRLRLYEEMIHGLANLFAGSDLVTREEFDRVSADLLTRHQGVQALEWVPLVRQSEREAFTTAARAEYPGFTITEPDGRGDLKPAAEDHPELTVIRLLTPLTGNEAALGYANSLSPIGPDLQLARQHRALRVTHQFRLAQTRSADDEFGIVYALPVYRPPTAPEDDGFRGFVQGVFRIETMIAQSHRFAPDEALFIQYRDLDATGNERALLYLNRAGREERPTQAKPLAFSGHRFLRETLSVGGRRWEFLAMANPAWRAAQETLTPWLALLGGLITTGIAFVLANLLLRRTTEIEEQVALRTAELEGVRRNLEDDIRRRQAAETALQASEQRLEAIIDNSPACIFVKDLAGRYVLCNRGFEQICGKRRHDILGRTAADIFPADIAEEIRVQDQRTLQSGTTLSFDELSVDHLTQRSSLLQKFPLRDTEGRIYALCGISTDITERVNAEKERIEFERRIQQTQRLESLGVLAGGIAHDFNNILTAVLGHASLARHLLPPGAPVLSQVEQIEHAARRAAELCGQMLAYAGRRSLSPGQVDLSSLVRKTAALLEISVPKSARLHLDLAHDLPAVEADATQLRQIVMNLVINAADALGERSGEIHVSTALTTATAESLHDSVGHPQLPGGHYVRLTVRDTGCGIPAETLTRIFEPFYTTKFAGRGLGLSAVLGIVRSHRGALFVESEPERGSSFSLLLPASSPPAAPTPVRATDAKASTLPTLSGSILVIDDEANVRDISAQILTQCGLTVRTAEEGEAGLRLWREHAASLDLILLDLTMPGWSGMETLDRLRAAGATQPVLLMSGYSETDATRRSREKGVVAYVQKPFELAAILQLIARHLPGR